LMAQAKPDFRAHYGVLVNISSLVVLDTNSKFEPVIGKPGDGASPSCAIVDEYHEHKTSELYDTMATGMGARSQPLMLVITTAGSDISGPCYLHQVELQKILEGVVENDQRFGIIFGIDEGDDWTDPAVLQKANPNYGISVDADFLLIQQRDAIADPRKQNVFKTKHLNVWVAAASPWVNLYHLQQAGDPSLTLESFRGEECVAGLDLASKQDIASRAFVFERLQDGERHYYAT
jgi:phage terminase large subunit-like protein